MKRNAKKRRSRAPSRRRTIIEPTIVQIIPADPRWHALFESDERFETMPVVCFALVELGMSGGRPFRIVRPMIVHDAGLHDAGVIDDVNRREGFVCLLPPCDYEHAHEYNGQHVHLEECDQHGEVS